MSWLAVKYALACRDERVKLGARLVLVAIGVRVEYRRITTSKTSLDELRWLTFLSHEQIRRVLDDLEEWGKVRRVRRGKNAIYALPEMAGPLFALDDGDPVKMTDFVVESLPKEIGHLDRKVTGRMPGFRRRMTDFSGRRAGGVLFSEVPDPKVRTSTAAGAAGAAVDLLAWLRVEHPRHNRGAAISVTLREVEALLADVLVPPRDLARVKAMFVALWTVTPAEDRFLSSAPDKGCALVRHAADRLDRISRERERSQPAADRPLWFAGRECPHEPKCATRDTCAAREMEAAG